MKDRERLCACGSGLKAEACCGDVAEMFGAEEAFTLFHQFDQMRRTFKSLIGSRNPTESAVDPKPDKRLTSPRRPLEPDRRPHWHGLPLTRETLAYPTRAWSDDEGGLLQEKLYVLCDAFGEYLADEFGTREETVSEYEDICRAYCDFLLMYYTATPLEIRSEQDAVRRFLGNYYPRTHLDANLDFVFHALNALPAFHAYLARLGLVRWAEVHIIRQDCQDASWFRRRLLDYRELQEPERSVWSKTFDYKAMPVAY